MKVYVVLYDSSSSDEYCCEYLLYGVFDNLEKAINYCKNKIAEILNEENNEIEKYSRLDREDVYYNLQEQKDNDKYFEIYSPCLGTISLNITEMELK